MRSQSCKEQVMNTRRSKLVPFPVTAEGAIDLPDGAVIVSLDFETQVVKALGAGQRQRGPKCLLRTIPTHEQMNPPPHRGLPRFGGPCR